MRRIRRPTQVSDNTPQVCLAQAGLCGNDNQYGLSAGINGAYSFGAKAPSYKALTEYALSLFIDYRVPDGVLKNMALSIYCTWYNNDMNARDRNPYTNAFQDETDFKFIVTMPFSI